MKINGNVADLVLAQLAEWGVQRIYGVAGDAVFPLLDAMSRQDRIAFIATVHESGASFAASYEAALTGAPAVCAGTCGPGAVNLLNGLADAYVEKHPVLALTGQVATQKTGPGTPQYFDQQAVYRNFAECTCLLADPAATVDFLLAAFRKAVLTSSVVHISLPKDILSAPVSADTCPAGAVQVTGPSPTCGDLPGVVSAVRSAHRPLVVMGRQARKVTDRVLRLAYILGAGLVLAQEAKGAVPGDHELNLGGVGEALLPPVVTEADCIVLIGGAPYEQPYFPPGAALVHLAERPGHLRRSVAAGAVGDLGLMLETVCRGLENHAPNRDWLDRVKAAAGTRPPDVPVAPGPMHPLHLMEELDKAIPEDAVISLDVGEFIHWFDRGFAGRRQDVLLSGQWECIGAGLPAAIGAKLACPDRTVVAVVGDGGFLLSMAELLTCVRYNVAVPVIVVKNGQYSLERNKMVAGKLNPFGIDLQNPDFVQFARACGAEGFRVEDITGIKDVLGAALGLGKPALIEVPAAAVDLPQTMPPWS